MKKNLTPKEKEIWRKYKTPGCSNLHRLKVNAIFLSVANSKEHELAKCSIAYDLMKNGEKIITEAQECKKEGLRRDLVSITTGEIYEIDNSKTKRGNRHDKCINVYWYDKKSWRS